MAPRNERWYGTNHGGMVCYQWYGRSNTIHTIVTKVIIIDVQRLTPHIYTTLVVYMCQHFLATFMTSHARLLSQHPTHSTKLLTDCMVVPTTVCCCFVGQLWLSPLRNQCCRWYYHPASTTISWVGNFRQDALCFGSVFVWSVIT